ncbi:type I-F CRISPR-associated protein Csy2 [Faucicola boevrei]|uniref:type I-F CRISPR-associated protein Csy2 n=1 Tax=Faucicola boevrei TaxID=346665 RepID=UPI0003788213|nr:type I-F CRISPR-associated protein Csy2 [Moraxella boevrei]
MANYILLERIQVENANAIAGFTYGFPAITAFLGFEHALSRKLKDLIGVEFNGCAIFCHDYIVNSYQDFYTRFIQSRNPPSTLKGKSGDAKSPAPIIEEGKIDMTVSILLRCDGVLSSNSEILESYNQTIKNSVYQSRLAGGSIKNIKGIYILSDSDKLLNHIKHILLPSFVLIDGTHLLKEHFENTQHENKSLLNIWTDFFAFKEMAIKSPQTEEITWQRYLPANKKGWIVPLMIGYKGISPLYSPEQVENLRDTRYPFRFVEAVHGLGEWRSVHRIQALDSLFWQYHVENEWYLCQQNTDTNIDTKYQDDESESDYFDDIFNN